MATTKTLPTYRTIKQEAERVGLSERTLRRYIAEGKLRAYKAGKTLRIRPEDTDAVFTATTNWE
ncbi:helix-turn-helix domain-containing protein [Corynebacterium lipophiloflavum]|uniref:DNA binding domain, excisionase family n=1 Tax=Corynebacterium lipophiloflavum (strain ATCC 700352 / DSM 44291 / CCUG 37336 / JCM 10383 / DMMZ 1944) TaxID=525263 RepID=C0XTC2_CORLD|nr:helix-turn-helix domain-containing protein [Corynebacterium lipophiloflavum]EEI16527.1 DNA binding domain, excisionase family [Corynebacterium lipophiloflavum DSM 44291]